MPDSNGCSLDSLMGSAVVEFGAGAELRVHGPCLYLVVPPVGDMPLGSMEWYSRCANVLTFPVTHISLS